MNKLVLFVLILIFILPSARGQVLSFTELNTSNGLSDNYILCHVIDQKGFLWIGTSDGLNRYDGHDVTNYFVSSQPGLPSDTIRQLFCDHQNRLWITGPGHVAYRQPDNAFHPVYLPGEPAKRYTCYSVLETRTSGIVFIMKSGHFAYNETTGQLDSLPWLNQLVDMSGYNTTVSFSEDQLLYVFEDRVLIVDVKNHQRVFEKSIPGAVTACRYNPQKIAVSSRDGHVELINLATHQSEKQFHVYNERIGQNSYPGVTELVKLSDGSLAIASIFAGMMVIDSLTDKITYYHHDPLHPATIIGNTLFRVFGGQNGELIISSNSSGVSIGNIYSKGAYTNNVFRDTNGAVYDGALNTIAEDRDGLLWICTIDRLMSWDRKTNASAFYPYFFNDPVQGPKNLIIRTICIDEQNRYWIGVIGAGVALFDPKQGKYKLITADTSLSPSLQSTYVNDLMMDSQGKLWVGTYSGLYLITGKEPKIEVVDEHPILKTMIGKPIISFYEDRLHRIWIGTQRYGMYCYDPAKETLTQLSTEQGLLLSTASSITGDRYGNIYTTHLNGFSIVDSAFHITHFSRANGLLNARCESIIPDSFGYVWIANNKCLVRYDPVNHTLENFEENAGITTDGFRYDAVGTSRDGMLYFGSQQGLTYFHPDQIQNYVSHLRVSIDQVTFPDTSYFCTDSRSFTINYTGNSVQFHFVAIDLIGKQKIAYQYLLEGYDNDWQKGNDQRNIRYGALPSGKYTFRMKASLDRQHWTNAENTITLIVAPPLWKRWWFIISILAAISLFIFAILQFRVNQVRAQEKIKSTYNKQMAETEMRALRAQMNPHFIFNSLNSINKYILKSDQVNASRYLTRFAKLIRLILDNSNHKEVALSDELEALKLYLEMESLRFTNKFQFEILVDPGISTDTLQVPPLIIQPFVENAIWHGLLHKGTDGKLVIQISKTPDQKLKFIIEDNGIGRARAMELKSKSATASKSLGMKLTEDRINVLNQYNGLDASIDIIDLTNPEGEATGTRVVLTIPI